jgi:hypothetical protein
MSDYNLLCEHPRGDTVSVPCVHLVQQHSGGDSVPCVHPSQQHPGGDQAHVPCMHLGTQHGYDEVKKFGKKFKVPCVHVPPHPEGHDVTVPCVHIAATHPGGDTIPCVHVGPQHPGGDQITGPCVHLLSVTRFEPALHLIFHTNDKDVQRAVLDAVHTLKDTLHINGVGNPLRPLHIFSRDWAAGFPEDATNPFWSHYERGLHAIQICPRHRSNKSVVLHELGHALAGTQLTRIRKWNNDPHYTRLPHSPAMAMGEGWAHFVALALLNAQDAGVPVYDGLSDWETRDPSVPKTHDIEYNIACLLWDLYDRNRDMEGASFSFKELFSVLSPTLETLDSGLVITGIDDYLDRLRRAFPNKAATIDRVRDLHISSKKLASGLVGGPGGSEFWDDVEGALGISKITVRSGALIDAIQADYRVPGGILQGDRHGGSGGSESSRELAPGERITSIDGQTNGSIIKQMTFHLRRELPSGGVLTSTWSVGQPGPLWITLVEPSGSTTRVNVVPGGTLSVAGTTVAVPSPVTVGSTINVPGRGALTVEGENAFHLDCTDMVGFYGRSGSLLDAIGMCR